MTIAAGISPGQMACSQSLCQNGGTCQQQGLSAACNCKPGFTGQRCESGIFTKLNIFLTHKKCPFRIFSLSSKWSF
jgi:hypothetical protein